MTNTERLELRLTLLRDRLENARPKLTPFKRPFTFEKEIKGTFPVRYKKVTEVGKVTLSRFGVCEEEAIAIGLEIKMVKKAIENEKRVAELQAETRGRKAILEVSGDN